jgi:peptidoglycan/xylan/chitin deacetylase (PgdA/CDA1 family)
MKTNVYLTVDVESSMGGAWRSDALLPVPAERRVFCKIDGIDYGIGWQTDELERRGFRATFFCEVLSTLVLGEADTSSYLEFLLNRGQDVQLHTHPNFYFYAQYLACRERGESYDHSARSDSLWRLSSDLQKHLLSQAIEIFKRLTGNRPLAYRAGGYQANKSSLSILSELGLLIDSSFNPSYSGSGSFDRENLLANVPQAVHGVWEIPVTVAIQDLPDPRNVTNLMPFEISALSMNEMRRILDHAHCTGTEHVVIMFHSFSGVKPKDVQYSELRPDHIVRRRFTGILNYLAASQDRFRVSTFGELAQKPDILSTCTPTPLPRLGYIYPLTRKLVQLLNRPYRF